MLKASKWIDGFYDPRWIREELVRKCLVTLTEIQDEKLNVGDEKAIVALLKACGEQKDLHKGTKIHADVLKCGLLGKNTYIGNALVSMYVKCSEFVKAEQLLGELPKRDVVTWTALIAGYAQHGCGEKAFTCFEFMQREGLRPNLVTFISILKACGIVGAADKGKEIHDEIIGQGLLGTDVVLGTALVDMYAKCGMLAKAQQVLDELPDRNVVTWNALLAGYAQHECCEEAFNCLEQMQHEGIHPNAVTFICILKACASVGATDKGKQIHDKIVEKGLLGRDIALGNALVDMYVKCGELAKAQEVLDELAVRDVKSWTALIAGYAQHGHAEEALDCFERMRHEGLSPDSVTFVCILKACGSMGATQKGKQIHDEILRQGLLGTDIAVGNAVVDMYAKCGEVVKAQEVLCELPERNVVTWTALIAGYAQHGCGEKALGSFKQMQNEGLCPNAVTFICILKACGSLGATDKGKQIHCAIVGQGLLGTENVLGNALVDMYAKSGEFVKAEEVLDELPNRDVVTWTALIAGYAQHGQGEEAFYCFERMQREGHYPNAVTFICILKACGIMGATDKGKQIHDEILRRGLLGKDIMLGNALVDMYAKCGALDKAHQVLEDLLDRNVISWSALIAGYAQHGHAKEALNCFKRMQHEGFFPNAVTITSVLNACSHTGLVNEGQTQFTNMSKKYGITPNIKHLNCMVDLYGRAGHFDKAVAVIKKMPSSDHSVWMALLGACRKFGNVKLGSLAFQNAVELDKKDASAYAWMSHIYTAAGMQVDAEKVEVLRVKNEAWI